MKTLADNGGLKVDVGWTLKQNQYVPGTGKENSAKQHGTRTGGKECSKEQPSGIFHDRGGGDI